MKNKNNMPLTLLLTTIAHVLWGFSFMASRTALNHVPILVLLSHRFLIAFLLMNLAPRKLREHKRLSRKQLGSLLLLGLLEPVIYFFGEQYGLLHSTSIFSGVMIAGIPIVATLAAWPLLKERPTLRQLLFCVLSVLGVVGVALLSGNEGRPELIGVLALLVAVFSAVGYSLLSRSLSQELSSYTRTYAIMAVGAVAFTPLALWQCRGDLGAYIRPFAEPSYLLSVLFLAVFCSVICYALYGYSIARMTVAREAIFANLTTAVSVFAGAVFLHEPFSVWTLLCCALMLLGVWGVQRSEKKPEKKLEKNEKSS